MIITRSFSGLSAEATLSNNFKVMNQIPTIFFSPANLANWWRIHLPMQETQEMWVRPLGWEDPLEEEMATHSRMLTWEIPRTEEPGRLQSIGLQRVGHNWACVHTHTQSLAYYHLWWLASSTDTSCPTEVVGSSQGSEGPAPFFLFSVLSQISLAFGRICLIIFVKYFLSQHFTKCLLCIRGHQCPGHWRSRNKWNTGLVL